MARRSRRRWIVATLAVLLAAWSVETWLIGGLLIPVVVSGGSMAPALMGAHRHGDCPGCGASFDWGLESLPADGELTCSHCGAPIPAHAGHDVAGQRVLIDRLSYHLSAPRRLEVVALHPPDDAKSLAVKRVVGLPGEHVLIDRGEVWLDGQLLRKSVEQARAMRVLVSKENWRPLDSLPSPLAGEGSTDCEFDTLWFAPPSPQHAPVKGEGATIRDNSHYDPTESRLLDIVPDVVATGRLNAESPGPVLLRAENSVVGFTARLDLIVGDGSLVRDGRVVSRFRGVHFHAQQPVRLEWGLVDRQFRVLANDVLLLEAYDEGKDDSPPGVTRLALGGPADLQVHDLTVWRDVYYRPPSPGQSTWEYQLGDDEYLLLGDNPAHSLDGRHWSRVGGVRRAAIVGRVLAW